jgi:hypothetical protein
MQQGDLETLAKEVRVKLPKGHERVSTTLPAESVMWLKATGVPTWCVIESAIREYRKLEKKEQARLAMMTLVEHTGGHWCEDLKGAACTE